MFGSARSSGDSPLDHDCRNQKMEVVGDYADQWSGFRREFYS